MNIKDILLTANANLLRNKLRTSLTILAIFIGAFTLALTTGLGSGISAYVSTQVSNLGASNAATITAKNDTTGTSDSGPKKYEAGKVTGSSSAGGPPGSNSSVTLLTDSDITTLKADSKLSNVVPARRISPAYIVGVNSTKYQVSQSQGTVGANLDLAAGANLDVTSASNQLIIPIDYVTSLGYSSASDAVGKTVTIGISDSYDTLHEVKGTIVGVQNKGLTGSSNITTNRSLSDELYTQQSIGLPEAKKNQYVSASVTFNSKLTDAEVTNLKNELSDKGYAMTTLSDALGAFHTVVSAIVYVLDAFAVIALLAASFGIINTLLMSVQERTKEIGLMKAMGMRSSRIFALFSIEAILIGFWGSAIGVVVAQGAGILANNVASKTLLKDLPGFTLLDFPVLNIVGIVALIMAISFIAGVLPARKAAKQNPIDALRYE